MKKIFIILSISILLISCKSVIPIAKKADSITELQKIQDFYKDNVENTKIGMNLVDFILLWKDAVKVSETENTVTYEVFYSQIYYTTYNKKIGKWWSGFYATNEFLQKASFRFKDNKLIQYEYSIVK